MSSIAAMYGQTTEFLLSTESPRIWRQHTPFFRGNLSIGQPRDRRLTKVSGLMIFGKSDDKSGIKFNYMMDSFALGFVVANETINTHEFNTLILQDINDSTTLQAGYYDEPVELPLTDTQTYIIGDYFAGAVIEKILIANAVNQSGLTLKDLAIRDSR